MTVAELIEKLNECDPTLTVARDDTDYDNVEITSVHVERFRHDNQSVTSTVVLM